MFSIKKTKIKDCFLIDPLLHKDQRGLFVKSFHKSDFESLNLNSDFKEDFYSISKKGVIRGLHLAKPPSDHEKTVTCLSGEVVDVVLDLRIGSPTFGMYDNFVLSEINKRIIYIGKGIAHGFLSKMDNTILYYKVTSEYEASNDIGIRWDSINFSWPISKPVISERDSKFPTFEQFRSRIHHD